MQSDRFEDAGVPGRRGADRAHADSDEHVRSAAPADRTVAWALQALAECRDSLQRSPSLRDYDKWQGEAVAAVRRGDRDEAPPTSLVLRLLFETEDEPWPAAVAAAGVVGPGAQGGGAGEPTAEESGSGSAAVDPPAG